MSTDNRELIQKADMRLADLAPGGLLNAEQLDKFIRLAVDDAVAMRDMTEVRMKSPTQERSKIRYGTRVLRGGSEATALPVAERSRPTTSKVTLSAQLIKGETRMSYETLEDSIERGTFEDTVRAVMAEKMAEDLEDLAFNGDTTSSDTLLAVLDGFIKQATSNVVPAGSASISREQFKNMLKTMPSEFRKDKRSLVYYTADEVVIDYHELYAARETAKGDAHTDGMTTAGFEGIPVKGVPVFPTNLGGTTDETVSLLLDPGNMLFGIWREVRIDTDKDIIAGEWIIVVSARVDFKYGHEPAVVQGTEITAV